METDRRYFVAGLFVIGLSLATAVLFAWLGTTSRRDDVVYQIHFNESVSGLAVGDPVKFQGVDVGTVKAMGIDPADPERVRVDVNLRKDTPVKTDTRAVLKLKGFTGVMFIELSGGSAGSPSLLTATAEGEVPEIASEKSKLATVLEQLPQVIAKFSALEDQSKQVLEQGKAVIDQGKKALGDVGRLTGRLKENPSLLIFPNQDDDKEKGREKDRKKAAAAPKRGAG